MKKLQEQVRTLQLAIEACRRGDETLRITEAMVKRQKPMGYFTVEQALLVVVGALLLGAFSVIVVRAVREQALPASRSIQEALR